MLVVLKDGRIKGIRILERLIDIALQDGLANALAVTCILIVSDIDALWTGYATSEGQDCRDLSGPAHELLQ